MTEIIAFMATFPFRHDPDVAYRRPRSQLIDRAGEQTALCSRARARRPADPRPQLSAGTHPHKCEDLPLDQMARA